jgi:hypothetical protein
MKFKLSALTVVLVSCAALASAQAPLTLQISGGRVTLHAQNVPIRTILAEWARVGGAKIVNGDRVAGAPLTLELDGVPERQALDIILRSVSGYVLAARDAGAPGASMYDRIMILPTSVAPRNPTPAAAPVFQGAPAGFIRPIVPRQADDQNGNDDGDATGITPVNPINDGVPLGRPVPRPIVGGVQVAPPVMPPRVAPETNLPQTQQPGAVVGTPSNPFGLPAGSSVRPGVITPPPQPVPQGAGPRPQN